MSISNSLKTYHDSLNALQVILDQGKQPAPEYMARFRQDTMEFFNRYVTTPKNFHEIQDICAALRNTIEKMKRVEILTQSNTVKTLCSIADLFRAGKDKEGLDAFNSSI